MHCSACNTVCKLVIEPGDDMKTPSKRLAFALAITTTALLVNVVAVLSGVGDFLYRNAL